MRLPFSHDQFTGLFALYNAAIWPAQIVAYALGLVVLAVLLRPSDKGGAAASVALAAMWAWTGVAYHGLHFARINPAAWLFGAMFVLQAIAFATAAARLRFGGSSRRRRLLAAGLISYAIFLYPLVGLLAGYSVPSLPMFGVTPCPLVLFTLGVLLLGNGRWWLWVVPLAWSFVGGTAAFLLGVPQDWPLLLSGPVVVLVLLRDRVPVRRTDH